MNFFYKNIRHLRSLKKLTQEQLEDALFELADLWCPSISESEYCEFFDILHQKIKYVGQNDPGAYDLLH